MNAGRTLPLATEATDGTPSAGAAWSPREHAALPARALGPKASLRQSRRRTIPGPRPPGPAPREAARFETADSAVTFLIKASGSALYVERIQRRPIGTHQTQCLLFTSADEFVRWCDAEPLRFDDPGLHQRLARHGREFFGDGH